jgi:hypothetical protein
MFHARILSRKNIPIQDRLQDRVIYYIGVILY